MKLLHKPKSEGGNRLRPLAVLLAPAVLIGSWLLPGCATSKSEQVPQKSAIRSHPDVSLELAARANEFFEKSRSAKGKIEAPADQPVQPPIKPFLAQPLYNSQSPADCLDHFPQGSILSEITVIKGQVFAIANRPFAVSEIGSLGITLVDTTLMVQDISQDCVSLDAFLHVNFGKAKLFEKPDYSFCISAELSAKGDEVILKVFNNPR